MRIIYLLIPLALLIMVIVYVQIEKETEAQTIVKLPKIVTYADNTVITRYTPWSSDSAYKIVYPDGVTCYGRGEYLTCFQRGK